MARSGAETGPGRVLAVDVLVAILVDAVDFQPPLLVLL